MAASSLTTPAAGAPLHDQPTTRTSTRSKRTIPSPALALASLRTSFSRASIQGGGGEQHTTKSTTPRHSMTAASPSTTPLSASKGSHGRKVDSGIDLQAVSPSKLNPSSSFLAPGHDQEDYFDDILDKYCQSDEDPTSPSTASPTSPFSTGPGWGDFQSPLPPTPPVNSSRRHQYQQQQQQLQLQSQQQQQHYVQHSAAVVPPRRATPLRNSSTPLMSDSTPSTEYNTNGHAHSNSPMLAASARFNAYLQSTSNRNSRDSLSLNNNNNNSSNHAMSSSSQSSPTLSMRSYIKRPVPVPGSSGPTAAQSPKGSTVSLLSVNNNSTSDLRGGESRPELPPKDNSRVLNMHHQNGSNSQVPLQPYQGRQLNTFSTVVEETMRRNKTASVSSFMSSSSASGGIFTPYAEYATLPTSSGAPAVRDRSNSNESQLSYMSSRSRGDRYYMGQNSPGGASEDQLSYQRQLQQQQQQQHRHHHIKDSPYQQQQQYRASQQYQSPVSSPHPSPSPSSAALTPSEMLSRRFDDRARTLSQGSLTSTHTSRYSVTLQGKKSAMAKSPIARTRAREENGSRKVIFGDMITVVTVERAETPPPVPPMDKKKMKEKLKKAKKSGSSKTGPHPDPEYDSDYYNAPYTPEPAEVVIAQAPWIGNPNYDEEKQNSSFYYGDDYENEDDDYDYEAPSSNANGFGQEDEDEDEDEDEEDEEDERNGGRTEPKKKGGMFKFKRAVNRFLRN